MVRQSAASVEAIGQVRIRALTRMAVDVDDNLDAGIPQLF
jgi:hypothetical protein